MSQYRLKRVQNLLRDQISAMIMRGVVKDPRVTSMVSITEVKVSKDIAYADIFVSSLEGKKKLQKAVAALNHAAGFIQHKLRDNIHLRTTPVLRFKADPAIERGFRMTKTIEQLTAEREGEEAYSDEDSETRTREAEAPSGDSGDTTSADSGEDAAR